MDRLFVDDNPPEGVEAEPRPLPSPEEEPAVVVLGDPGAGKTQALKRAADSDTAGLFLTVGQLLNFPVEGLAGKNLYVDGLDERRHHQDGGATTIDAIAGKLMQLHRPKFRVSCRSAEWYGELDQASLRSATESESICVMRIEPLSNDDVEAIAVAAGLNGEEFLNSAVNRGVEEWLGNPLNLELLLEVVAQGGWPHSRAELFELASRKLIQEHNPVHARQGTHGLDVETLLDAAGFLCAVQLLSDVAGMSLIASVADHDHPYIGEVSAFSDDAKRDREGIEAALQSRLYRSEVTDQILPFHRALSEYVAARFLSSQIRHRGYPLRRALALMSGFDNIPSTQLRGIYAWMTTLLHENANTLISIDPLALLIYGDVSLLGHDQRVRLLEELRRLESKHAWYRHEIRASEPFGALGSPDMESTFLGILSDPLTPPMQMACVLDALTHGASMPHLGQAIMDLIRDGTRLTYLRLRGFAAYQHACAEEVGTLRRLLADIHSGVVNDPDLQLRGLLFERLYPEHLTVSELAALLVSEEANGLFGKYHMTLEFHIPERTSTDDIPGLLDALAVRGPLVPREHRRTGERLIGKTLLKGLECFGENEPVERLFRWLIPTIHDHVCLIRQEESSAIRTWFEKHTNVFHALVRHWLDTQAPSEKLAIQFAMDFLPRLQGPRLQLDFIQWALEVTPKLHDDTKAVFLFELAIRALYQSEQPSEPTLTALHVFASEHPRLVGMMEKYSSCPLDNITWKWRVEETKRRRRITAKQSAKRLFWKGMIEDLRAGNNIDALTELACIYFGIHDEYRDDLAPARRLAAAATEEIAKVAKQGFVAVLRGSNVPPMQKIVGMSLSRQIAWTWYTFIAGIKELFGRDPDAILQLSNNTLASLLVLYHVVGGMPGMENGPWYQHVVRHRPQLTTETLLVYFRTHLNANADHISGVHSLTEPLMGQVATVCVPHLLRDHPYCSLSVLDALLRAAMLFCDPQPLLYLTKDVLRETVASDSVKLARWLAVAYYLAPAEFSEMLPRFICGDRQRAAAILHTLVPNRYSHEQVELPISVDQRGFLLEECAGLFDRIEFASPLYDETEPIHALVNGLARDPSDDATVVLAHLQSLGNLGQWQNELAHARALQTRTRRDAEFRTPQFDDVVAALTGGRPGNVADLHALVTEQLLQVKNEIERGQENGWKMFWNTDGYGRLPGKPKPKGENEDRDTLLIWLRPVLAKSEVLAEKEGPYANDTRTDIKCTYREWNIPVEVKRQDHRELWSAPISQLHERYTRDPGAQGRGIYLVLWFGSALTVHRHPKGVTRPGTPDDLVAQLNDLLPDGVRALTSVMVIDVSPRSE